MRFILWDTHHDLPFGLINLQSPILKTSVRDKSLGIPNNEIDYWVDKSMSAQRVGALPPYNELIKKNQAKNGLLSFVKLSVATIKMS